MASRIIAVIDTSLEIKYRGKGLVKTIRMDHLYLISLIPSSTNVNFVRDAHQSCFGEGEKIQPIYQVGPKHVYNATLVILVTE